MHTCGKAAALKFSGKMTERRSVGVLGGKHGRAVEVSPPHLGLLWMGEQGR
jgi:hypothetical protein